MEYATQRATLQADDVSIRTLSGKEHVVAPATLVQEMVLKGEFLPFEEIEASHLAWNSKPTTITHPKDGDKFVPASSPEKHESHVVGKLFDIDVSNQALVGDVYIDKERSAEVAESLDNDDPAQLLLDGENVEGSIGYWYERFEADGEFDGDSFEAVAVNIQPDHYALLPNATGECSIADGCGVGTDAGVNTSAAKTAWQALRETVSTPFGVASCNCDTMSRAKELAEKSAFDEETLQDWDESQLDALEDSLETDDTPPQDDEENSDEDLADNIAEQVMSRVDDKLDEFEEQQTAEERQELVAQVVQHSDMSAEDLEEWKLPQIEAFAEQVTPSRGVYAGSAGASGDDKSGDDFVIGLNGRHLEGEN